MTALITPCLDEPREADIDDGQPELPPTEQAQHDAETAAFHAKLAALTRRVTEADALVTEFLATSRTLVQAAVEFGGTFEDDARRAAACGDNGPANDLGLGQVAS